MKQIFYLKKSRWLLFTLLALFAGMNPAWAQKTLPYSYGFETALADEGWARTDYASNTNIYNVGSGSAHDGSYVFRFYYNTNPPQYLISPELTTSTKTVDVSFWYKNAGDYTETFNVGYSTSNTETGSFTWLDADITAPSSWTEYKNTFPAGTKYIAIKYTAYDQYQMYIDDFSVEETPTCIKPTGLTAGETTYSSVALSWTNGSVDQDAWQIAYSTTSDFNPDEVTPVDANSNPFTLNGLTPETTYYAYVRGNCGAEDKSAWSNKVTFTTPEKYPVPTGLNISKLGTTATLTWTVGGEETTWEVVYSTSSTDNPDELTANSVNTTTYQMINLTVGSTYYVWIRAKAGEEHSAWLSGSFTLNYASPTPTSVDKNGITNVTFGSNGFIVNNNNRPTSSPYYGNYSTQVGAVPAGTTAAIDITFATGYTYGTVIFVDWNNNYEFEADEAVYKGTSAPDNPTTLNATFDIAAGQALGDYRMRIVAADSYYDNYISGSASYTSAFSCPTGTYTVAHDYTLRVITPPSCATPTALTASNVAARSVDLGWTVDDEEQDAWQIVYATDADFDPAAATPVTAGTNPFTLTGLTPETTYYAYVRAYCSESDQSAWSNKVSFTTLPSCIAPTALTIGSVGTTTATLTWTDETEQTKWEVSYSTTSGAPDDGTIVAVTEKTYTILGLTTGTTYYASVRAVNSDEDKSAWSSEISFTPGVLTVNDGTTTNSYVPLYGGNVSTSSSSYVRGQFVIPEESLGSITDNNIDKLVFYSSTATRSWGDAEFTIYLKKMESAEFTSTAFIDVTNEEPVYSGKLSISGNQMEITFTESFEYTGGNLLVDVQQTASGSYGSSSWYGIATSSYQALNKGSYSNTRYQFLPKVSIYYSPVVIAPKMRVAQTEIAFGLVEKDSEQTATFTIENKGKADLDNITITCPDGKFSVDKTTITKILNKDDANYEAAVVTVTLNTETPGDYSANITVSAEGQDPATIAVSGVVKDPTKMFIDFAGGVKPEDWTATSSSSSYSWSYGTDGNGGYAGYNGTSSSYVGTLTSPEITFTAGEKICFNTARYGNSTWYNPSVTVEESEDGTTWNTLATYTDDIFGTWTTRSVSISSAAIKYIRFKGWYFYITNIYGGVLPVVPNLSFTASDYGFGMITAEKTTEAYTIQNTGLGELTGLSVTSSDANFVVAVAGNATTIEPKSSVTFTVTMKADAVGSHNGTITVAADGFDDITFNVSGYVIDNTLFTETFEGNALPDGWENTGWTFANGEATGAFRSPTKFQLITPALTVAEGEKMAIEAQKTNYIGACTIPIYISKDGGEFTLHQTISNSELEYNVYKVFYIEGIPAGNYKIRFDADATKINAVNGFHLNQNAPAFEMATTGAAAFGKKTANDSKTYTVRNAGTGTLTVNIASDNTTDFTVSPAQLNIAGGETADFNINFVYNEGSYGNKSANITVTPTYNESLAYNIAATAKALDPDAWDEDFEEGTMPTGWDATNWTVGTFSYSSTNNTQIAKATANSGSSVLITPRLQAQANDVLTWEALYDWYDESIRVEYSDDDKQTWNIVDIDGLTKGTGTTGSLANSYRPQDNGSSERGSKLDMSFTAPADGYYYLRFTSSYNGNGVDNFNGFKLALKEHDVVIQEQNIRSTFNQYGTYDVSVTVKEMVGKEEELTAKFYIGETQYGESVTETVEANGTKTFTVSVTLDELISGNAYFTINNANISLESDKVAVTTNAAIVLDETVEPDLSGISTTAYQDVVALKYTAKAGWNTICVPFKLTDTEMTAIFGEGYKAYEFKAYNATDGLNFQAATTFYAGYPYIVYSASPATLDAKGYIMKVIQLSATSAKNDQYSGATFQGTYAPMAAGSLEGKYGVTNEAKIAKGSASATMKGFRAYFDLPAGAPARLTFFNEDGTTTSIMSTELDKQDAENIYNLQGQKVTKTSKAGLYIKNGKKVIVK